MNFCCGNDKNVMLSLHSIDLESNLYCPVPIVGLCIPYVGKFWSGKKLANLVNRGLFANILLANYFFLEYSS